MTKKLTPELLMKIEKDLGKKKIVKVTTNTGEVIEVEMYDRIRESLIDKAIMNFIKMREELENRTFVSDELAINSIRLLDFFLLKEISDLPIPDDISIEESVGIFQVLIDSNIAKTLIENIDKADQKLVSMKTKEVAKKIKELAVALKSKTVI